MSEVSRRRNPAKRSLVPDLVPDQHLVEGVIRIAAEAASRIMAIYHTDFTVRRKHDRSPVTTADLEAHECISAGLSRLVPELPIISEEFEPAAFSDRTKWMQYWLIDPLDGTREFVKRNGEFTVNIALIRDHQPVLGVVYVPPTKDCYHAGRGLGAFKRAANGTSSPICVRKTASFPLTVVKSRSHSNPMTEAFVAKLGKVELIGIGSALKSCLVAEGRADVYPRFGPTSEWDTAAAQCVVEEAGGRVTDTLLKPLRYNLTESLTNPAFLAFGDAGIDWREYLPG